MSEDPDWNANRSKHIENLERSLNDRDDELHRQIQFKLEAIRVADERKVALEELQKALAEAQSSLSGHRMIIEEYQGQLTSTKAELEDVRKRLDDTQSKLHAFESAMEWEKKADWVKWHMDLADRLDGDARRDGITENEEKDLRAAAINLRYMADSFTLKANFVPSELRIRELETQLASVQQWLKSQGLSYEFPKGIARDALKEDGK